MRPTGNVFALHRGNGEDRTGSSVGARRESVAAIEACRVCGGELTTALDLGVMPYSGIFPTPGETAPTGPLEVVLCRICGLAQLGHVYDPSILYADGYGYRSALNGSMVDHLKGIADEIDAKMRLRDDDLVVDIGSNDGTLLSQYRDGLRYVGVDPLADKYREGYPGPAIVFPCLFQGRVARTFTGQAKAVTSIACFYDLPDPAGFAKDVIRMLRHDGVWVLEQSCLPMLCAATAYDSICHEHTEYYTVNDINRIVHRAGGKVLGLDYNTVNGGSVRVVVGRWDTTIQGNEGLHDAIRGEKDSGFGTLDPFKALEARMKDRRRELLDVIAGLRGSGSRILGYGASTKGNVLLHYCGIGRETISAIAEVNADKFGRRTPGTDIPIVSENAARELGVDAFLVMPWHFRDAIIARERGFLGKGGKLIFPLPNVEIVG